jgi:hypothetical protein
MRHDANMKSLHRLMLLLGFLASLSVLRAEDTTQSSEKPRKGGARRNAQGIVKRYDRNRDGRLDDGEIAAVRKAFADGSDRSLKRLDRDRDGKLDARELGVLQPNKRQPARDGDQETRPKRKDKAAGKEPRDE